MAEPKRIRVQDVREKLQSGSDLLLVCIYSTEKYNQSHLDGAISMEQFEKRLPSLSKEHEITFY